MAKVFDIEKLVADLKEKGKKTFKGLGTFKVSVRKARTGRNPATGEAIDIPEKKTVKFKASTTLKELVNGTDEAESAFGEVVEALKSDGKKTYKGLGTFKISERKARTGRNPATGEAIDIPATKTVRFKASNTLKDAMNS